MGSGVQMNGRGCYLMLCLIMATTMGACAELKSSHTLAPPTQATPEQAAERERDSQSPKAVQARSAESPHQACQVTFDDEAALRTDLQAGPVDPSPQDQPRIERATTDLRQHQTHQLLDLPPALLS